MKGHVLPMAVLAFLTCINGRGTPGDENWDEQFGKIPGVNGWVTAIAVAGQDVYVGGWFSVAGGVVASNIARWDGTNWYSLGDGIASAVVQDYREVVSAIAVDDRGSVFVGGRFTSAGGIPIRNGIARWDGTQWHPLENSLDDLQMAHVRAIVIEGTNVYAGGEFWSVGDQSYQGIGRWDGIRWHSLGLVNSVALCLAVAGDNVYAGGYGREFNSPLFHGVARWDGTTWRQMGSGLPRPVLGLAVDGTNVYAVGPLDVELPGIPGAARWDGQQWRPLIGGDGLPLDVSGRAVAAGNGRVYIGGALVGPTLIEGLIIWEEGQTTFLDQRPWRGYFERTLALVAANGRLYAGGRFTDHSGKVGLNIAAWDGQTWSALSSGDCKGIHGTPTSLTANDHGVFVGSIRVAGDLLVNNIARWDGNDWHTVGAGLDGDVFALVSNQSNVYAGVVVWNESNIGILSNYVARWDGTDWVTLGQASGVIRDVALSGDSVYVTGDFSSIGGKEAKGLARWNGSEWQEVGGGIPGQGWGSRLGIFNPNFYVSVFQGGDVVTNLLIWDGTRWAISATSQRDLIDGFTVVPYVNAIAGDGVDVFIAGDFNGINGARIAKVARWDGQRWVGLGSAGGVNVSRVSTLQFVGTDLYVGGEFSDMGGVTAVNTARWDGALWHPLGSGLNGDVSRIAARGRDVFFIGGFSRAGGKSSIGIARWTAPKVAPALQLAGFDAQSIVLSFPTAADVSYVVERADSLEIDNWVPVATKQGDGKRITFTDTVSQSSQRFYRLRAF